MTRTGRLEQLAQARIVAVIRAPSRAHLVPLVEALLAGGVSGIEVTTSTPDAIEGIREVVSRFGDAAMVGVGTVLDAETAQRAVDAGATFVVSPVTLPAVIEATLRTGALSMPGAYTPTEVFHAWNLRADVVKVFPATTLGPGYLKDLRAPMPFLRLMPTGGVEAANVADWLSAGAIAVGAGSSLVPASALATQDWPEITRRALAFTSALSPRSA